MGQLVPNLLAEITCPFKKGAGPSFDPLGSL